jgi:hypothetical protein
MCELFESDLVHKKFEVTVFFDRLRQPDNLPCQHASRVKNLRRKPNSGEIHGFAPSPRDEFAIIVCNLYLKDQCRMCRIGTHNRQFIKQNLPMLVNAFYRCRFCTSRGRLNVGKG